MGELDSSERKEELVKKIRDNIRRCKNHLGTWRNMAIKSYAFYGNDQWDDEDIVYMEEAQKAPITFNRVTRTISAVMGIESTNRQSVNYYPRKNGASAVNELLTGAANWVRDTCDAEDEESQAFRDTLICGLGWTETRLDYEVDRDGNVIIERRDPLEMGYDINSKKDNLDDAKFFYREIKLTKEEFGESFPDHKDYVLLGDSYEAFDDTASPHDASKALAYNQGSQNQTNDNRNYRVVQYQWYEPKHYWLTIDFNEQEIELENFNAKKDKWEGVFLRKPIRIKTRIYKQAFLIDDTLLDEHDLPVNDFTFRPISGLYNRKRNLWYGLVELMKDPQMWANKWLTEVLYILRTNASGGFMYEPSAFENGQRAIEDWAKPNSMIKLTPGGAAKIFPKVGIGGFPDGMMNLLQFAVSGIQETTGVNVEMLGMADRNQPIGLEKQRKEAGTGIMSPFFSALRRYHKEQGRVLAEFIIGYISDGRLVRIAGEEGSKYVQLLKDELTFKYDIIVDESTSSPDVKGRVFEVIGPMIPALLQAGIPVPPEILDYFPIPSSLRETWKKMMAPKEPSPEELQQKQQQEEEQKIKDAIMLEMQMNLINSEANYKESQAQLNRAKIMTERMTAANKEAEVLEKASGASDFRKDEEFLKEQARRDVAAMMDAKRKEIRAGHLF